MLSPRHKARRFAAISRLHRSQPRTRGQAVVEFAMILPVFLFLTIGIIDAARMFSAYESLTNGVTEAAIYAAQGTNYQKWCTPVGSKAATPPVSVPCPATTTMTLHPAGNLSPDPDNIAYRIDGELTFLNADNVGDLTMAIPTCTPTCAEGNTVAIGVTFRFRPLLPISLLSLWPDGLPMTATTNATILP
jgi:Flp pilus assembly protein TadG